MILAYLHGALLFGCFVIGLRFLKYWRLSRDRFFIFFAAAFWAFMIGWGLRAVIPTVSEHAHLLYLPRLLGFTLIVVGIIDKNRRSARE